jgi:hypothetical protein
VSAAITRWQACSSSPTDIDVAARHQCIYIYGYVPLLIDGCMRNGVAGGEAGDVAFLYPVVDNINMNTSCKNGLKEIIQDSTEDLPILPDALLRYRVSEMIVYRLRMLELLPYLFG